VRFLQHQNQGLRSLCSLNPWRISFYASGVGKPAARQGCKEMSPEWSEATLRVLVGFECAPREGCEDNLDSSVPRPNVS
jgi:hypothetical protein